MGGAFSGVVESLVNDILLPPIGLLVGRGDFSNLFFNLCGAPYATLAQARKAGAVTVNYGVFLSAVFNLLVVAMAMFAVVRTVNRWLPRPEPQAAVKEYPYCCRSIAAAATRCPHCASAV